MTKKQAPKYEARLSYVQISKITEELLCCRCAACGAGSVSCACAGSGAGRGGVAGCFVVMTLGVGISGRGVHCAVASCSRGLCSSVGLVSECCTGYSYVADGCNN